ncbi:hypothetical protein KO494_11710 [Lacinutrix sp. C3R15]|uniref:hypothetical protein n=1 Tax=Flavobacteriaceae TaxID=49546 RepID=UPI001C09EF96|nr:MULTISPECIES: hypothetical protein [Flavobacteriaceae]MBU2940203.1 hypothetical protein [Lacinutrix sp. C3R15]MDO6623520.1 hypothetical protein [Oceanihabitans sp. 1_MG-2023]
MKLVPFLSLFVFSIFSVSAQDLKIDSTLQEVSLPTEITSVSLVNEIEIPVLFDENTIARKKSYKYIIENTLSGRKNLIFKTRKSNNIC